MAEQDDPADALARLEAALDRIAEHAAESASIAIEPGSQPPGFQPPGSQFLGAQPVEDVTADVATRLDALILQLREALAAPQA